MAEQGSFRRAINGFNKTDVLEYIDALQSRYSAEIEEYKKQADELKEQLNAWQSEYEGLKNEVERYKAEIERMSRDSEQQKQAADAQHSAGLEQLTQEIETLRLENSRHLSKIADLESGRASQEELSRKAEQLSERNERLLSLLRQEKARSEGLEKRVAELEAKNKKYDGLVGDAGAFIFEMYSMGQRFLEIAYKRSDNYLESLEQTLKTLTSQLAQAKEKVKNARQELLDYGAVAGLRLDELMQSFEASAGKNPDVPAAAGEDKQPLTAG